MATDSFHFQVADQNNNTISGSFPVAIILPKPIIVADTGLTVGVSGNALISLDRGLLATETWRDAAVQLVYTVTTPPVEGGVLNNGEPVTTFTQADIDNGLIARYQETGGTAVRRSCSAFSLTDPSKNVLIGSFSVKALSRSPSSPSTPD